MRKVVITGIGILNASGIGIEDFWSKASVGQNSFSQIDKLKKAQLPTHVGGQIQNFDAGKYIPRRFLVKIDTFTKYAWVASSLALEDANLNLEKEDSSRIGVWLGNNGGGWDICERGLYELYRDGVDFVNPWQATAWFLSSPQGYLTIGHHICGNSKSFVCDRASSASALHFALRSIQEGENDIILTGGTEAPLTPFAFTCYFDLGEMATAQENIACYKPFDEGSCGLLLGEGATILVFEEYEHALKRNAKIYGEVLSSATYTDANPSLHHYFVKTMKSSLEKAKLTPEDVDVIFAEGAGSEQLDRIEVSAVEEVFKSCLSELHLTCPKSGFGHLYGASSATDVVCGLLSAQYGKIAPTPNVSVPAKYVNFNLVQKPISKKVQHFLINSRAREGANYSMVIKAY